MSGPLLTIVVPTVDGREHWLERCLASYFATTPEDTQILVYRNRATCGIAWNEGIAEAAGAYVHLTADDIEAHPGWWKPAISATDLGWLPAPRILNGDGSLQSCGDADEQPDGTECEIARIPFASRAQLAQIGPMLDIHYYCVPSDHRALTRDGFKHHWEMVEGEMILAFDHLTHEVRWEPLLDINVFPYDGEMLSLDRKGDRFEFTPEHKWPTITSKGVRELRPVRKGLRVPVRGEFDGTESILSPRHAALLGWLVGDGHVTKRDGYMWISQSPTKYLDEIVQLVGREPQSKPLPNGVRIVNLRPEDRAALSDYYTGDKSVLPAIAARLSREAAAAMLDAIVKAEGSNTTAGGTVIAQSCRNWPVREAVQILSILCGSNTSLGPQLDVWGKAKDMYLKTAKTLSVTTKALGSFHYSGEVWCPSTPSRTWWVEHDGACLPTGNTDNWFSHRGRACGYPSIVVRDYLFTHHLVGEGRIDTLVADGERFFKARGPRIPLSSERQRA